MMLWSLRRPWRVLLEPGVKPCLEVLLQLFAHPLVDMFAEADGVAPVARRHFEENFFALLDGFDGGGGA